MKRLLFFLIAIVFAIQGWTQGEISIGANGTGTALVPINHYYNYNYSQMLYEQSSLTAGTITAIKFKYSAATGYTVNPVVVYMKTTTKSSFSSTSDFDSIGLTQVFSGSVTSATGWVTITLTTPYVYDGTGNLLIAVDNNYADYDGSSTSYWNNLPTADNKTINAYSDTYNPDPLNPNGNASTKTVGQYIPSLTVVITPTDPTFCFPPTNIVTSNIVVDGAQLTWDSDVNVSSYSIEYKTNSQTWAEATLIPGIVGTTYTFTNLISNTLYDVKVIPTCSSSLPSIISFRTACGTISSLPYSESFDTYGTGSGIFLTCWGRITSTPTTYPYIATTNSSAPGSMYMYTASGAYNYIATPEFDASIPINTLSAFFKLYKGSAAYNITVGVMTDPNDTTTFDSITNLSPTSNSTWQTFGVNFANYTGIGQYIAFKVQGYGATNAMYIDDLEIDISPVCTIPTGLTDYDSLATPNSMELDWDGADDANVLSWIVEYKPIDSTTWQSTQAFSHPFSLTGLLSGTVYQIRLYAICSSGDTTYSTPTMNVGLPCEVITTIPWYEGFENVWFVAAGLNTGTHPWCWTNIDGGASTTYKWRKTTTSSYIHSGSGALQMYASN
ncbi:MAG: fibronectin type III domain-containing protein, partial [Bacteroidales bacterium]|nr:fibronectin type III domain-containing protein [Bacteroidales bacterium]